jgi:hypothetical protein
MQEIPLRFAVRMRAAADRTAESNKPPVGGLFAKLK